MKHASNHGFSIVELSVVLAVVGLLIGAILGGQSMVRSTRVKSVSVDLLRYADGAKTFKGRFKAFPGDMPNASLQWGLAGGAATANDATCNAVNSIGKVTTCNGDGDNDIDTTTEGFRFWQHLSNAQIIEGSYSGTAGGGGVTDHVVGTNCPATKITSVGISVRYVATALSSPNFAVIPNNVFTVGAQVTGNYTQGGAFTAAELLNMDTKLDDGVPGTGNFIATPYTTCTNGASASDFSASYKLTVNSPSCYFYWINAF